MSDEVGDIDLARVFMALLEEVVRKAVREELNAAGGHDQLLTADQAANVLGFKSRRRVYVLGQEKKLTPVRIGKNVRYRQSEVSQLIASGGK